MGRARRAAPETRREEILEAALACFSARGYHGSTVDDIAAGAGLSKGAVYWHFEGKREIFLALLELIVDQSMEAMEGLLEGADSAREALHRISRAGMLAARESGLIEASAEFTAQAIRDAEFRDLLRRLYERGLELVGGQLQLGIDRGEFRPFDVRALAAVILAATDGLFLYAVMLPEIEPERVWPPALDALLDGVSK